MDSGLDSGGYKLGMRCLHFIAKYIMMQSLETAEGGSGVIKL